MTNELEKQFFQCFGIGKPKLKVWRYSGYYEDYSWDSELIDCAELLERNNWTIEELNERIQTSKQEEREKNSELYDYRFDSVETEFGKTTKAFVEYPTITDRILLGIIAKIMWSYSCTQNDFDAYEVHTVDDLKEAVLKHAIELSKNDAYVYCGVRKLFEEGK